MEDNSQAAKVLTPLADEALSASAKGIPYVCVPMSVCVRRVCARLLQQHFATAAHSRPSHDTQELALRTATVASFSFEAEGRQSKMATNTFQGYAA